MLKYYQSNLARRSGRKQEVLDPKNYIYIYMYRLPKSRPVKLSGLLNFDPHPFYNPVLSPFSARPSPRKSPRLLCRRGLRHWFRCALRCRGVGVLEPQDATKTRCKNRAKTWDFIRKPWVLPSKIVRYQHIQWWFDSHKMMVRTTLNKKLSAEIAGTPLFFASGTGQGDAKGSVKTQHQRIRCQCPNKWRLLAQFHQYFDGYILIVYQILRELFVSKPCWNLILGWINLYDFQVYQINHAKNSIFASYASFCLAVLSTFPPNNLPPPTGLRLTALHGRQTRLTHEKGLHRCAVLAWEKVYTHT